jgi:hypothetical protein
MWCGGAGWIFYLSIYLFADADACSHHKYGDKRPIHNLGMTAVLVTITNIPIDFIHFTQYFQLGDFIHFSRMT